jgi:Sulfotransferase family
MQRPAQTIGEVAAARAPRPVAVAATRVPDFFIVGQPKSGTTALYSMLRHHPQIYMPETKEPGFLAEELHVRKPPRPSKNVDTFEDYLSLFAGAAPEQCVGEATPFYLWSRTAAARIARLQPQARIIATLREPASLLHSLHLLLVRIHVEPEADLRTAIELEPLRREGRAVPARSYWPHLLRYSEQVRYVEQLRRYHAVFPREQMLVLIYDDFRADNERSVREVLRFLDVDGDSSIVSVDANPTVRVRSQRLHNLIEAVTVGHGPAGQATKAAVKALTSRRLRRRALVATKSRVVYGEPLPPDAEFMHELRRRFKPEVEALSEYLGRDLVTLWGYDGLG